MARARIVDGSLKVEPQPSRRVSQVWVYYGQRRPTGDLDDDRNYHSRVLRPDAPVVLDLEGDLKYGTASIVRVFSRWIPKGGRQAAENCGDRIFAMGQNTPLEAEFRLHNSAADQLALGRYFALKTKDVQDEIGAAKPVTMAVTAIARGEFETSFIAQSVAFAEVDDGGVGVRRLFIENDFYNINLRSYHDSFFPAPTGDELIEYIVLDPFDVGSTSTGLIAMDTGSWPAMTVAPRLVILGRVQGKGGAGGRGGGQVATGAGATSGGAGGMALKVRAPFTLDGNGRIWSGGGGGGGGDYNQDAGTNSGGGGGGGGAGTDEGAGGAGGVAAGHNGGGGGSGTDSAGGTGGQGTGPAGSAACTKGGNGGGPGLAGGVGATCGDGDGPGGAGPAGVAIDGISFVTFDSNAALDIRGAQVG